MDEQDQAILGHRIVARDGLDGPRVGDFVLYPDGSNRRIAHLWHKEDESIQSIQPTWGKDGSFYLNKWGGVSMSGGLDTGFPPERLELVEDELQMGNFWFFSHDHWGEGRGITVDTPCRIYAYTEGT